MRLPHSSLARNDGEGTHAIIKIMKTITYDYSFMLQDAVGEHGISEKELHDITPKMVEIGQKLKENKLSFTRLPYDTETMKIVQNLAQKTRDQFESLIVLGIGGSDL